jgi:branched-chain amino acid transport system permease protein
MPFLPRRPLPLLIFAAILAVLPFVFTSKFQLSILLLVGVNAIVCVGLNLLVGNTGQISLGHAAFFGIGAYASAVLTGDHGWNAIAAASIGIALSCTIALAVGWPILRLKDNYLAMATLGVGLVLYLVLVHELAITGGPDGRAVASATFHGVRIGSERAWYWIIALALVISVWAAENLSSSPWGLALKAIHASEPASAAVGINVHAMKVMVFVYSAGLAAFAGNLYAHAYAFVTPDLAGFMHSVEFIVMIVIGGLGSVYGGIVGAAIVVVLPQILTSAKDYEQLIFGLMLMTIAFAMRKGVVPTLADAIGARR